MELYENFNTTNQTRLWPSAHENFVTDVRIDDCSIVQQLPYSERCDYVRKTETCDDYSNFMDYINFLYCTINARNQYVHLSGVGLIMLSCCYMFAILGTTADVFFCPALTVLAQLLHMSENVAGVTLLAFGNGSPDLFTSLANTDADTALHFSELFGAAAFITSIIAGTIIIIKPFRLIPESFIRDCVFFIFASSYIDYLMRSGNVSLISCISILLIYILYLVVVISDQIGLSMAAKKAAKRLIQQSPGGKEKILNVLNALKKQSSLEILEKRSHVSFDISTTYSATFYATGPNSEIFSQFFHSINPLSDWDESGNIMKFLMILKAPVVLILYLIIPVVDYNVNVHGWSKLLNVLQIITLPHFIIILQNYKKVKFFGFSIFLYSFLMTIPISVLVFFTSRTDRPPKYHFIFALAAMVGSITVIATSATEVVNALQTLGIVSSLSPSFLGATILAWGNSIGDLISNIALARQGYQRMGFAACYGGPLFNCILGLGLVFLIKAIKSPDKVAKVRQGSVGINCVVFLFLILAFTLIALNFTRFMARRSIGIFMFCMYGLFLLYNILGEFEIIHTYGTDHQE